MQKIQVMKIVLWVGILSVFNPLAWSATGTNLALAPNSIDYSNPADSVTDGQLLTGGWNVTSQHQFCEDPTASMTRAMIVSSSSMSNMTTTLEGATYRIFSSSMPEVGWIMGAKDTLSPNWTPLTNNELTVFPFDASGENKKLRTLGAQVRFAFVKLPGTLPAGSNLFNGGKIADFKCYQGNNLAATASISVNSTSINVKALSCKVSTPDTVSIALGEHITTSLPAVNGTFGGYPVEVQLNCQKGVVPWMTITDVSNSGNTTNILQLTADSTAKGVGVQVFYNNEGVAKRFGPDRASKGNTNQFFLGGKTATDNSLVSIPLNFKYIRTQSAVTPGTANAAATVTFSYQ